MPTYGMAPHRGQTPAHHAPNAALLIDFDNVTMGIRSDLTKELKNLLNSDIIKGKVAVQRAYADWRRYPQYIVPLSEASVDLIFAPAYGSSKKNATDIRLAIDALELVFTRPEIGTVILLSGDSDFSSLVLKLKEYGKYVIGVGLRESASDLLVQNCDEYYSYSGLTGLTKAGDEQRGAEDPWVLVERSVQRMSEDGDVMRSDRLKQVMLELDPSFDEKTLGFSKFNKFVTEAANRNCLRLRKMENGQYEVEPFEAGGAAVRKDEKERERPSRERARTPSQPRSDGGGERSRRERGRAQEKESATERPAARRADRPRPGPQDAERPTSAADLPSAYALLQRAVRELGREGDGGARDSDVKRRILEISPNWDESEYGFQKFSRFLRQAHDAEVVTLRRTSEGYYEVLPGAVATDEAGASGGGERDEARRGRPSRRDEPRLEEGERQPAASAAQPAAPAESAEAEKLPPEQAEREPAVTGARADTGRTSRGVRSRRGRGRTPDEKPPILPGQIVGDDATEEAAEPVAAQPAPERPAESEGATAARPSMPPTVFEPEGLGLPTESGAVVRYLANSYKGVGEKTAETLIDSFGAERVFEALETQPERVREVLGAGRRTDQLLEAWEADRERRLGDDEPAAGPEAGGEAVTSAGEGNGGGETGGRERSEQSERSEPVEPVEHASSEAASEAGGAESSSDRDRIHRGVGPWGRRGGRGRR